MKCGERLRGIAAGGDAVVGALMLMLLMMLMVVMVVMVVG